MKFLLQIATKVGGGIKMLKAPANQFGVVIIFLNILKGMMIIKIQNFWFIYM